MTETMFADGKVAARIFGTVGHLVLNNPLRKNSVNLAMWKAIPQALEFLVTTGAVRVVILSGEGGNDFSAGADIGEFSEARKDRDTASAYEAANSAAFRAVSDCPVPVIALIRGICFGGGLGLAAACDLRMADETARFAIPAAKLGLAYPPRDVDALVRALGEQKTKLLLFTGNELGARAMVDCGFLLQMVHADRLTAETTELAAAIVANAPMSVRAAKLSIRAAVSGDEALAEAASAQGDATFESKDYAEGRLAFAERRKPVFTGQ